MLHNNCVPETLNKLCANKKGQNLQIFLTYSCSQPAFTCSKLPGSHRDDELNRSVLSLPINMADSIKGFCPTFIAGDEQDGKCQKLSIFIAQAHRSTT